MTTRILCCFALALTARAGVISGIVVEHASGRPLARSLVRLQPVPKAGSTAKVIQVRAGIRGDFNFLGVPDGLYLLIATRDTFFPAGYGQRRPNGQGAALTVTADSNLFAELRMHRMGSITGRVLDENGVGMSGVAVIAYRARLPLRSAGRAVSDDRGIYRIHSLDPGKYWVRSVPTTLDDGSGRLATFGTESREIRNARIHMVQIDQETYDADVVPEPGRLFRLTGRLTCDLPEPLPPAVVTLSSETGRRSTQAAANGGYAFEALAPGAYEVSAVLQGGGASGFVELQIDRDSTNGDIRLSLPLTVDFDVRRGSSFSPARSLTVIGRRQDLSEAEAPHPVATPRASLEAGHWEFAAFPGSNEYAESIANRSQSRRMSSPDWFDLFFPTGSANRVTITISPGTSIAGSVIADGKPAPAAPVFLWPVAEAHRRSINGPRVMIADVDGKYRFDGLPPGDYRLLATFDATEVDEELLDAARAVNVHTEQSNLKSADLTLWIAP
jgi:protocatechuate 3,4-dioxygenase beta subunit